MKTRSCGRLASASVLPQAEVESNLSLNPIKMDQEETMESLDQPLEEESQDQPDVESEDDSAYEETEEQPEEDSEESEEEIPVDELKAGYLRQQDYTKKTQELAQMRKELEELKASMSETKKPKLSPEHEKARQTLKQLGFVSKDEVLQEISRMTAKQRMDAEKKRLGVDEDVYNAARYIQSTKQLNGEDITIEEAIKKLTGKGRKVVKRKAVGTKGGVASQPKSSSNSITLQEFEKLDPNSKKYEKVVAKWREGKLKIIN